jgi:uncharacterized protein
MNTKEQLILDLKSSMKNQEKMRTRVIRMVLSSIKLAEVEKGEDLDPARILSILQKEIKTREETIEEAKKANRPEMISSLVEEIEVIREYLPKEIDDEELEKIIDDIIQIVNADSIKQMGLVMQETIARVAGRASNDRISKLVKSKLS